MKLGTEVGLGPGDIVLDGDPVLPKLEMWANAQRDGRPAEHRW